ncbi:hypothetical protein DFH06DRAFT_1319178 [Mycena polygramma]|nr:hypothetical protein DFH06DRAFT_1319178 [Mycena polygramma]
MLFTTSLLSTALFALASTSYATPIEKRVSGVTYSSVGINGSTFDYIVVGGGLSEDPDITVLLIEAGEDDRSNPEVYDVYEYSEQGKVIHGGKTLGGSSSINGGHWTRGLNAQYDAWSTLLEDDEASVGWNWAGMFNYMKKSEAFSAPNSQQAAKGAQSIASYHGTAGPNIRDPKVDEDPDITVLLIEAGEDDRSNPEVYDVYEYSEQGKVIHGGKTLGGSSSINGGHWTRGLNAQYDAWSTLLEDDEASISHFRDLNGGTSNCVSITPFSIDWHRDDYRSSSVEAYLTPATGSLWGSISSRNCDEYAYWTNQTTRYFANARREVIIAAGAIQSPVVLQLSGIGDSALLGPLGIKTQIDLKTVGKNLQEQTENALGAGGNGFDTAGRGPSDAIAYPNIYQLFDTQASTKVAQIQGNLTAWATSQAGSALSAAALQQIYQVQANLIINNNAPVAELFYDTGFPDDLGIVIWQLLPFSRGSVKIRSTDPFTYPTIQVNYFGVGMDLDIQVAAARLSRRILTSPPLNSLSTGETVPGSAQTWIMNGFASVAHSIGTASMMRRELGGVVDARLKVYDTSNVRVVDASVLPIHVSAHLASTLYGAAEKAADLIKAAQ